MSRARDIANLQSGAIINEAGADLDFRIESDDNANMFFVDGGNDKIGIGTNSPNFDIHVHQSDSTNSIIQFTNSTTGTTSNDGLLVGINSSEQAQVFNRENTDLLFATNNTERTRIGSSGEIQIGGTTNAGFIDFDGSNLQFNTQRNPNTGTFVNTGRAHTSITMFDGNGTAANSYIRFMTTNANNTAATERVRIESSGVLEISDSSQGIKIGSTDAAAYTIKRDSNGLLNFNATQTNFNGYIFDTADGERMKIDSSGRITKPSQPVFSAYRDSSAAEGLTGTIVFNATRSNVGSHYNTSTGKFTAPVTGNYQFNLVALGATSGGAALNGEAVYATLYHETDSANLVRSYVSGQTGYPNLSFSTTQPLDANDVVRIDVGGAGVYSDGADIWLVFSGFLIG